MSIANYFNPVKYYFVVISLIAKLFNRALNVIIKFMSFNIGFHL